MNLPRFEQMHHSGEGGKPAVNKGPSTIQTTALVERQQFLENIYYSDALPHTNKAVTPQMRQAVLDPINSCIHSTSNEQIQNRTGKNAKKLPSLEDWQARRLGDISFSDFKILVTQEAQRDPTIDKNVLLQEYIIRSVSQSLYLVGKDTSHPPSEELTEAVKYAVEPPMSPLSPDGDFSPPPSPLPEEQYTPEHKKRYGAIMERAQRSIEVVGQMRDYGVDETKKYYKHARNIKEKSITPKELDITKTDVIQAYPRIGEFLLHYKEGGEGQKILEKMTPLEIDLLTRFNERSYKIAVANEAADRQRIASLREGSLSAEMLSEQYDKGYEYLDSLIPQEERKLLDKAPYYILKAATKLRTVFPVANTEVLAQIWWQLRLGGARAKDIYEHLEREWPDYVKANKLKRYTEHLADNYLGSEAAGFELKKSIPIAEGVTPNKLLFETMKNLIHHHIPKNQEYVRFTLLDGENHIRKITLPYHEGITDGEINENIKVAMIASPWTTCNLNENERADLSYIGYNAKGREKDKNYSQIYKGFGVDKETKVEHSGDYLIQIGGQYDDSRDPRSLFAVDSHKAAVQIGFKEAGKAAITFRYNHLYFDGKPADTHSQEIFDNLTVVEKADAPTILTGERKTVQYLTEGIAAHEKPTSVLPLVEAHASYDDKVTYTKVAVGDTVLTPTDQRALIIANASGVKHYQQLVAGPDKAAYFSRNPNSNNIQPVVVAPSELRVENKVKWTQGLRAAVDRAKKGVGDVALFSAITGTKEAFLAMAGTRLNPRLTNMLSHAQGMVSAMSGEGEFTTAISNAYTPPEIDLNNPTPHMGVVGMHLHQDGTAYYTTRILPSQAQEQFRQAALDLCWPHLQEDGQRIVLAEFTKIIKAWDRLVGGGTKGKSITLKQYEKIRNKALRTLIEEGWIHEEMQMDTGEKLQIHLNKALQKAADDVFDTAKIASAREELSTLLLA
jgi:hypothetical protein